MLEDVILEDDYDCDFYSCNNNTTKITSNANGEINVEAYYVGHSADCDCDQTNPNINCNKEHGPNPDDWVHTAAAIRFLLTPVSIEGFANSSSCSSNNDCISKKCVNGKCQECVPFSGNKLISNNSIFGMNILKRIVLEHLSNQNYLLIN